MANRQHFDVWSGEDRTLAMQARDSDNAVRNLAGLTLTCRVGRPPNVPWQDSPVFTPATSVISAPAGTFSATIDGSDTESLHGEYMHQTTDQNGVVLTEGRLKIRRAIDS